MSDLLETIRAVSKTSAFNQWLNLEIISVEQGAVELHLAWRPEFAQYNGFLHASLIGGLIDTACGFAAATVAGNVLASQFAVRCLRPAIAKVFVAKGRVVKPGKLQIFTAAELYALDAPDKPFAVGDAVLVPVA